MSALSMSVRKRSLFTKGSSLLWLKAAHYIKDRPRAGPRPGVLEGTRLGARTARLPLQANQSCFRHCKKSTICLGWGSCKQAWQWKHLFKTRATVLARSAKQGHNAVFVCHHWLLAQRPETVQPLMDSRGRWQLGRERQIGQQFKLSSNLQPSQHNTRADPDSREADWTAIIF